MNSTIRQAMIDLIDKAIEKGYSKESTQIIGTIACSSQAIELGYDSKAGLQLALEYVNKYDNEKECINALLEVIK